MELRPCLVLTSTLKVDHPEFLRPTGRHQLEVRKNDTEKAFLNWMTRQQLIKDIVLVDNSGYSLDWLKKLYDQHNDGDKRAEFISYKTNRYSDINGRAIGELDILEKALEQSTLLAKADHFVLSIGRVFIPNSDEIISNVSLDSDIVSRLSHNLTWMESKFAIFRKQIFADRILPYAIENVNESNRIYIERVYAQATLHCIASDLKWYPLCCEPRIQGFRGLDSQAYLSNWFRAKMIDFFTWGYNRAHDVSSGLHCEHSMTRWSPEREASNADSE